MQGLSLYALPWVICEIHSEPNAPVLRQFPRSIGDEVTSLGINPVLACHK